MSTEPRNDEEVPNPEDVTEEHSSLDELAVGLAEGTLSRSRALKLVGAAILGGALFTTFGQGEAEARRKKKKRRRRRLAPSPPASSPPVCAPAQPGCADGVCVCPQATPICDTSGPQPKEPAPSGVCRAPVCAPGQAGCAEGVCVCPPNTVCNTAASPKGGPEGVCV